MSTEIKLLTFCPCVRLELKTFPKERFGEPVFETWNGVIGFLQKKRKELLLVDSNSNVLRTVNIDEIVKRDLLNDMKFMYMCDDSHIVVASYGNRETKHPYYVFRLDGDVARLVKVYNGVLRYSCAGKRYVFLVRYDTFYVFDPVKEEERRVEFRTSERGLVRGSFHTLSDDWFLFDLWERENKHPYYVYDIRKDRFVQVEGEFEWVNSYLPKSETLIMCIRRDTLPDEKESFAIGAITYDGKRASIRELYRCILPPEFHKRYELVAPFDTYNFFVNRVMWYGARYAFLLYPSGVKVAELLAGHFVSRQSYYLDPLEFPVIQTEPVMWFKQSSVYHRLSPKKSCLS